MQYTLTFKPDSTHIAHSHRPRGRLMSSTTLYGRPRDGGWEHDLQTATGMHL